MYELYKFLYQSVNLLPKRDRYVIGIKIEQKTLDIFELFILAENKDGASKLLILQKADINIKILKYLLRLAYENEALPESKYIESERRLIEVGKMLGGWIKANKLKRLVAEPY